MNKLTTTVAMLSTNVSTRYLAISGIVSEVGGNILDTNNRKTTKASRRLIDKVTFSEHAAGR